MENSKLFQQQALVRDQVIMILNHCENCIDYAAISPEFSRGSMYHELIRHKAMLRDLEDYINGEPKIPNSHNLKLFRKIIKNLEETAQSYKDYIEEITGCEYRD
jgi:hypothetical protein